MDPTTDYFKERGTACLEKIRNLQRQLPFFCREYFLGIENNTTPLTRLNYAYDLRIFFHFLTSELAIFRGKAPTELTVDDLNKVTLTHLELYTGFLSSYTYNGKAYTNENKGKSRKMSSVRAMFKYFFDKGYLSTNVAARLSMPKIREKEIIRLEADEVSEILDTAEFGSEQISPHQAAYLQRTRLRDTALLTLFLGTGIRISECVGLNVSDIDFKSNAFTVTRKGGARVILYFPDEVAEALKAYLDERKELKIGESEPALFVSMRDERLSTRAIQDIVKKYSRIVAPLKRISPHKLRSTYGTALYRETGDIYVVAEVLGHRDVNTTKKHYAAMSEDVRKEAAGKVRLKN